MLTLSPPLNTTYGEAGQANPLRWTIYHREGNNFTAQSAVFKCKDFFNEVVGWYYGHFSAVFGFSTLGDFKVNEEGVYLQLTNITKEFLGNVERIVQPLLREQLGCEITVLEATETSALVLFPRVLWKNTYYISKVSLWVRACNCHKEVASFEELQKLVENYMDRCSPSLVLGEQHLPYWWYCGKAVNSANHVLGSQVSLIHSNGFLSWEHAIKKEERCAVPPATVS